METKKENYEEGETFSQKCPNCKKIFPFKMTVTLGNLIREANSKWLNNNIQLSLEKDGDDNKTNNNNDHGNNKNKNNHDDIKGKNKIGMDSETEVAKKLQDELVACKLREAECCLGYKELQQKVTKINKHWQLFIKDIESIKMNLEPKNKNTVDLQQLIVGLKVKDAQTTSEFNEIKQKLIELETENNVYKRQEKKMREELLRKEEEVEKLEGEARELQVQLKESQRCFESLQSKLEDQSMMEKINGAEKCQKEAALRRKIAELELENQQLLASFKLNNKSNYSNNHNKINNNENNNFNDDNKNNNQSDEENKKENRERGVDDVISLLNSVDMSDIMTESFCIDNIILQPIKSDNFNLQPITNDNQEESSTPTCQSPEPSNLLKSSASSVSSSSFPFSSEKPFTTHVDSND